MQHVFAFFSGFRQSWEWINGIEHVWLQVRQWSSDDIWVLPPLPWNTDVKALATLINRRAPGASVTIVAYSWGVGAAAAQFMRELQKLDHEVPLLISGDGVARTSWLPTWIPDPTSLLPWRKLLIPTNVRRVVWAKQEKGLLRGHRIVAKDASQTRIEPPLIMDVKHTELDKHDDFVHMSLSAISGDPNAKPRSDQVLIPMVVDRSRALEALGLSFPTPVPG